MITTILLHFADVTIKGSELNKLPQNPATKVDSAFDIAINMVFGIFATIAVLMVSIGALKMVMSKGNPQEVAKARDTVIYASIGLVISLSAYIIVGFVVSSI